MNDSYNLQRFVDAQSPEFESVCAQLRNGRKTGCWMWFVFPQFRGLGSTYMSRRFAISSQAEAEAYMLHPILGPRLRECAALVTAIRGSSVREIFGSPDDLKFRSCMTLFSHATPDNQVFLDALKKYFQGEFDALTLKLLSAP